MDLRTLLLPITLVVVGFAGCVADPSSVDPGITTPPVVGDLLAGAPLWEDPQNVPHPAFNWPTLSSPANATNVPEWWKPIAGADLPQAIKGIKLLAQSPAEIRKGGGIALFGRLAIVPGYGADTGILDINDPAKPTLLSKFKPQEGMGSHRGAATIAYPDGRLVVVFSTGSGIDVWDITDPTAPEPLPPIKVGSHKVGVVPGTPIVYNAGSRGGSVLPLGAGPDSRLPATASGITEIFDLTDPTVNPPVKVMDWKNGYSCHHVYFWNAPDGSKQRGVCAGIEFTQIWDTKDPRKPSVIVSVPVHHGVAGTPSAHASAAAFSHFAGLSLKGNILMVGDEHGGGAGPIGCGVAADTAVGSPSTPIGATWFYDVKDEKNPRLLGWYSPLNDPRVKASPTASCTAHHGRIVPAQGRDMLAMSYYGAGVVLIDFTGIGTPAAPLPKVVDQYAGGTNVWETWYYSGYLFTGDLSRGLDVLAFE